MTYAKLIDTETIEKAPKNKGSIINYNLDVELMTADGYKPVIQAEAVENSRIYKITYSEDEENIYENIEYLETEAEADKRAFDSQINMQIDNLLSQINELDLKRIRAVCEPSIKDETTGETWLDYYNAEITKIRQQITDLQERKDNDITD